MKSESLEMAFPSPGHDYHACVDEALQRSEEICAQRGVRLTSLRRRVLEIVWRRHAPAGAYDILGLLNAGGGRVTSMSVYRALNFLLGQGFIHRLESRNAFVGCPDPARPHNPQFFICRTCDAVAGIDEPAIDGVIARQADRVGFAMDGFVVEVFGICPNCRKASAQ